MDVDHDHDHGYGSRLVRMDAADVAYGFRPRDVPERLIYDDESTPSIDDESHWIKKQLEPLFGPLSSDDISRFLCMHHVQKLDIPFIAMYLKEDCLSLLKDHPEQPEEEKSKVKWYRILWAAQELHKKWLLFQNQKTATEGPATIVICSDPGVSRAKDSLLTEYGRALFNKVSVAPPYQRNETAPPRVMACCWGPGDPATTLVMLDSCGEILDVLCTGPLSWESLTWTIPFFDEATQQRMNCDQERILKFVTDHQPDVTIIGAANMSCPLLREQLLWVSDTMMMKPNSRASPLRIVYGDESLARLYEISEISLEQLPGRSGIARRAVALGRYLQNPLAMVATLCGAGREILSWKLLNSPDENYLNPDEKYAVIEQVMIDVTNQVGLDINLAINHEWLFAPLQFISGLGPQKAASLKKSLVKSGQVSTRNEFATLHGMGAWVYVNAVGFLRVRLSGMLAASSISSQFFALLDDTRIHPDLYCFAEQMARDVYGDMDVLVQSIRDLPSYLEKLDIEAYARSTGLHYMMQTLCCIREELIQGFQEWRKKYEPSDDDMFYMMTGETRDTLSEGSIVQATIRRVLSKTAICTVGAGLICLLWRDDFKVDRREISDLSQVMKVGDTITCKIKSLQKKQWDVKLSSF